MADISGAETLARELNSQAKHHPRVSMLLVPNVEIKNEEIVIDIYWLDRASSNASDAVIRFQDFADKPVEAAGQEILDQLATDLDELLAEQ